MPSQIAPDEQSSMSFDSMFGYMAPPGSRSSASELHSHQQLGTVDPSFIYLSDQNSRGLDSAAWEDEQMGGSFVSSASGITSTEGIIVTPGAAQPSGTKEAEISIAPFTSAGSFVGEGKAMTQAIPNGMVLVGFIPVYGARPAAVPTAAITKLAPMAAVLPPSLAVWPPSSEPAIDSTAPQLSVEDSGIMVLGTDSNVSSSLEISGSATTSFGTDFSFEQSSQEAIGWIEDFNELNTLAGAEEDSCSFTELDGSVPSSPARTGESRHG
jgi:hypothetical protein